MPYRRHERLNTMTFMTRLKL